MYLQAFGSIPGIGAPVGRVPGINANAIHSTSSLLVLSKSGVKSMTMDELVFLFTLQIFASLLQPLIATELIMQLRAEIVFT